MKLDIKRCLHDTAIAGGAILLLWAIWWLLVPASSKTLLRRRVVGATHHVAMRICEAADMGPVEHEDRLGPAMTIFRDVAIEEDGEDKTFPFVIRTAICLSHLGTVLLVAGAVALLVPMHWIARLVLYSAAYPLATIIDGCAAAAQIKRVAAEINAGSLSVSEVTSQWSHPYWADATALIIGAMVMWLVPMLLLGGRDEDQY